MLFLEISSSYATLHKGFYVSQYDECIPSVKIQLTFLETFLMLVSLHIVLNAAQFGEAILPGCDAVL